MRARFLDRDRDRVYCGVAAGAVGAAPRPPPRPSSTRPSASMTETKIPPGSPVRIGFNVTLTLSPGLSVLAFQPERTRYGGGFISIDHRVAPFASVTSRSIQECGFVQRNSLTIPVMVTVR